MGPNSSASTKRPGETGASLVEYSLLVALIAIVALAGVKSFGQKVGVSMFESGQQFGQAGIHD